MLPDLASLTRRLSECPEEFLMEPRMGKRGDVHVDAVVTDLLLDLGGGLPSRDQLAPFQTDDRSGRNHLRLVLVCAWFFHDEYFTRARQFAPDVLTWLTEGLKEVARLVAADLFVTDPDRREELARLCLRALNLRPHGETPEQANDRLYSISSIERDRVIRETKRQEAEARRIRRAMEQKKAREAASKASREW